MVTKEGAKVMVQVRLTQPLVKVIDHLSVEWDDYRAGTMERLLREAIGRYLEQGELWDLTRLAIERRSIVTE